MKTKIWNYDWEGMSIFFPSKRYFNFERVQCNKTRDQLTEEEYIKLLSNLCIEKRDVDSGYKEIQCSITKRGRKKVYEYRYTTICRYSIYPTKCIFGGNNYG